MENVKFQVLGYRNFNKKDNGKPLSVVTVITNCTDQDNSRGSYGMKAVDFFLPDDKVGTLAPDCLGKEFIPEYTISGFGRPVMSDFRLADWKK